MIPPVGAVLIIDYWMNKEQYQEVETSQAWNWQAIVAVVLGIITGLIVRVGIIPINSLLVAGVVYIVLSKVKG